MNNRFEVIVEKLLKRSFSGELTAFLFEVNKGVLEEVRIWVLFRKRIASAFVVFLSIYGEARIGFCRTLSYCADLWLLVIKKAKKVFKKVIIMLYNYNQVCYYDKVFSKKHRNKKSLKEEKI